MKCIVYNVLDSEEKEFYVNVNGNGKREKCGVEVELTLGQIEALENCIWEHKVANKDNFRYQSEGKIVRDPRFRVIKLGKEEKVSEFTCPECEREFKAAAHLANHMRTHQNVKLQHKADVQPAVV